jgi:hypothetical protein
MKNDDGTYEGFCIDIMDALKERLNFEYTVVESVNDTYGNCKELSNGTLVCDGMVKMLYNKVHYTLLHFTSNMIISISPSYFPCLCCNIPSSLV